jgi:hypothetical protein
MPTPSLILVPARFKTGKLYTPLATTSGGVVLGASGDFNVTRATTATRFNSAGRIESVASGIPRLDYFASGGVVGCPALLVEPSAANGILNSQDTATNWGLGANLSSGYVDVIGVSGNNLTVAVSGSSIGAAAGRIVISGNNVSLASGSTYTISFLMRQTGTHTIGGYYVLLTGAASGNLGGGFDVSGSFSSGSLFNTAGTTSRIRRVEKFGTDVYRCSETFTMTASGTLTNFYFAPISAVTSQNNPSVGAQLAFAAPQIELGAVPTTFIPTTTAPVTRNADVVTLSGAVSGCIGQTEGTMYWEGAINRFDRVFFTLASGTSTTQCVRLQTTGAGLIQGVVLSGTVQCIIGTLAAITLGQFYKVAFAYKENDFVLYLNGVQQNTDTSGTLPTNLNSVYLLNSNGTEITDQRCRAAALYTTRLTNAELAALTTL